MTRTNKQIPSGPKGNSASKSNAERRQSDLSRTITKLLRHQAENEKVKISPQGWVIVDDLLNWKQLRDKQRFNPAVTLEDIFDVVEHDGKHGKGRFGLKVINEQSEEDSVGEQGEIDIDGAATGDMIHATADLTLTDKTPPTTTPSIQPSTESSKNNPLTLQTIASFHTDPQSPSSYAIRAVQGHSIKTIESEGLLTPITLDDPSSIPETVVHGTFYGAWTSILTTGGLKPMGRNLVHFATGPAITDILPPSDTTTTPFTTTPSSEKQDITTLLTKSKVISGMRLDAQILIYIDIKRCLQDIQTKNLDMKWFRSENGVILTEGVILPPPGPPGSSSTTKTTPDSLSTNNNSNQKTQLKTPLPQKIVPMEYWSAAVEIKNGIGVLWRYGDGIVRELPGDLAGRALPRGKQGRHESQTSRGRGRGTGTGRGGGKKPRVRVERDDNAGAGAGGGGGFVVDDDDHDRD